MSSLQNHNNPFYDWDNKCFSGPAGRPQWSVKLSPRAASNTPVSISVTSQACPDNTLTLDNVLFGDVYICSGQSNMVQPLRNVSRVSIITILTAVLIVRIHGVDMHFYADDSQILFSNLKM